jgi:photosystem II stability/assembly factor-like uncharacterized protein
MLALPMRGSGVFRSSNSGASWTECTSFPALEGARMDCAAIVPGLWLVGAAPGGLWLSADQGQSWRPAPGTEKLSVFAIASWSKDPRLLALGTDRGVWLSHDSARSFRRASPAANPDLAAIVSVAFDPLKAGTLYAGTPHLPWKTTDGGARWTKIAAGMFDDSDIFSIAIDPTLPSRVFASACSGIYCSLNSGAAWRRAQGIPGTNRRTYVVAQDPHQAKRVYAGTSAGMWRSAESGATWSKLNSYVATSLAFHPAIPDQFYISTERHGLLVSHDAGASFSERHQGFVSRSLVRANSLDELLREPDSLPKPPQAFDVRQDPFHTSRLLAASPQGLLRSLDSGTSWTPIDGGLGPGWLRSIAFHPKRPGLAFALRGQRVFWSKDAGDHWFWLPAQENLRSRFRRLEFSEPAASELLAVSEDRGLFSYSLVENPLE